MPASLAGSNRDAGVPWHAPVVQRLYSHADSFSNLQFFPVKMLLIIQEYLLNVGVYYRIPGS